MGSSRRGSPPDGRQNTVQDIDFIGVIRGWEIPRIALRLRQRVSVLRLCVRLDRYHLRHFEVFSVLPFNIEVAQACGPLAHDCTRGSDGREVYGRGAQAADVRHGERVSAERMNRSHLPVWLATDHQNARLALGRIKVGYSAAMSDCCATSRV